MNNKLIVFLFLLTNCSVVYASNTDNLPNKESSDVSNQTLTHSEIGILSADLLQLIPEQYVAKKTVLKSIEIYEKKHGFEYVRRNKGRA